MTACEADGRCLERFDHTVSHKILSKTQIVLLGFFSLPFAPAAGLGQETSTASPSAEIAIEYEVYRDAVKTGEPFLKRDLFLHVYNNRPYLDTELDFAIGLLKESAAEGYGPSQYILGELLLKGDVLTKNIRCGRYWLAQAAESGNSKAAFLIGRSYAREYYKTPENQKKNRRIAFEKAEFWLTEAGLGGTKEPQVATAADVVLGRILLTKSLGDERGWLLLERSYRAGSLEAMQSLKALEDALQEAVDSGNLSVEGSLQRVQALLSPTSD